jgi:hypothetical protein
MLFLRQTAINYALNTKLHEHQSPDLDIPDSIDLPEKTKRYINLGTTWLIKIKSFAISKTGLPFILFGVASLITPILAGCLIYLSTRFVEFFSLWGIFFVKDWKNLIGLMMIAAGLFAFPLGGLFGLKCAFGIRVNSESEHQREIRFLKEELAQTDLILDPYTPIKKLDEIILRLPPFSPSPFFKKLVPKLRLPSMTFGAIAGVIIVFATIRIGAFEWGNYLLEIHEEWGNLWGVAVGIISFQSIWTLRVLPQFLGGVVDRFFANENYPQTSSDYNWNVINRWVHGCWILGCIGWMIFCAVTHKSIP